MYWSFSMYHLIEWMIVIFYWHDLDSGLLFHLLLCVVSGALHILSADIPHSEEACNGQLKLSYLLWNIRTQENGVYCLCVVLLSLVCLFSFVPIVCGHKWYFDRLLSVRNLNVNSYVFCKSLCELVILRAASQRHMLI